jgi:hypothetical protein
MLLQGIACLLLSSFPQPGYGQNIPGGSGVPGFIARRDSTQVGGTVVVCLALSDGLVLAADSRLTITFSEGVTPNYKIGSDSAPKLFDIGKVAIASYGEAFLLKRSVGSIIADFDRTKETGTDVEDVAKRFTTFLKPIYDEHVKSVKNAPGVGFIVAGYNKKGVGEFFDIFFPTSPDPKLLPQTTNNDQGIVWRGQTEVIQRLIKGFDPQIGTLAEFSKLSDGSKKNFAEELGTIEYYVPYNYLMVQDGIDLALSLVQVTVDMQRFSFGTRGSPGSIPGIGGSVDVLVINPSQLTWIKRKTLTAR